jgi:hypothetical protein
MSNEQRPKEWFIIFAKPDEDISEAIAYKNPQHGAIKGLTTKYIEASALAKLQTELDSAMTALRCCQQIVNANGEINYDDFMTNLESCGLSKDDL